MQDTHLSDLKFSSLNLHPKLLKGVKDAGFEYCTPIQALALPLALDGQDVAGQAQTGTGKTAAFLLATMQRLILDDEKQATELKAAESVETEKATSKAKSSDEETEDSEDGEKTPETKAEKVSPKKTVAKKDLKAIRSLILAPTRELAIQIHKDAVQLGKNTDLKLGLAYGGTGYESQRATIEAGVDILIGTPGRVIDYFKQGVFHLKNVQVAVM
ncbi:MAG: DEAD/DEAH box helicase, partial [Proteobacteria bacterium]|nr:DEAD/DEAH box helicase [Pseudomonadota bacterium]